MNIRRKKILMNILSSDYRPTLEQLAEKYQIGIRSVRYDIQAINQLLGERKLPELRIEKDGQISFQYQPEEEAAIRKLCAELSKYDSQQMLPRNLRQSVILAQMFLCGGYLTAQRMAEEMDVSRNTIVKDLHGVEEWLERAGLKLEKLPQRGMRIVGKEPFIRRWYINLLHETLGFSEFINLPFRAREKKSTIYPGLLYNELLTDQSTRKINGLCKKLKDESGYCFSDVAYTDLFFSILYSRYRIKRGFRIREEDIAEPERENAAIGYVVEKCIRDWEREEGVESTFQREDCRFITQCLVNSEFSGNKANLREDSIDRQMLLTNLIAAVGAELDRDFGSDSELFHNLNTDVLPAIYRNRLDITVWNPHLEQIKQKYMEVYRAVKKHITPFAIHVGRTLSDHEIGFVAMHFIDACSQRTNQSRRPRAVVVCGVGFGSGNLLASKLQRIFDVDVAEVASVHNLEECLREDVDFVVTTVSLEQVSVPAVFVSPFLTEQDISHIRTTIEQVQRLAYRKRQGECGDVRTYAPGLLDVISERTICLDAEAEDFHAAIRLTGRLLEKENVIENEYTEAMVRAVREIGPYIVFSKGIALPHSSKTEFVHRVGISIVRLVKPVISGHRFNDPISLLIAIASPNKTEHIRAMTEMSELINRGVVDLIMRAQTPEEVIWTIEKELDKRKEALWKE